MKLYADPKSRLHLVTALGPGWVAIGDQRFERSLLLQPERIDPDWGPSPGQVLLETHLAALGALCGDVLLLGTGARQQFPPPSLLRPLIEAGIGFEIMDTAAACRTYNILVGEGRSAAAALILD